MSFLAVPLKRTSDIDLTKPFKNLIASHYSTSDDPINLNDAIDNLNKLRSSSTSKTIDYKHESSLESLERYCDQIASLESKCPPTEVSISFKWKDAFEKGGSFLMGSSSLSIPSISYEKVCVLFNIAAINMQIATLQANEGLTNDVALKNSARHFQCASGIFQSLKHLASTAVGSYELSFDMNFEVLHILQSVALAQAQEMFFYKAVNDSMKPHIIAKIANQCEDYYSEANRNLQVIRYGLDKEWYSVLAMKQTAFSGLAEYFQSRVCGEKKDFGEQIARLQKSIENLKEGETRGGAFFPKYFKEYIGNVATDLESAKKDNDFIYHAKIPSAKSLPAIGKALLAKPIAMPERFRPNVGDPFEKLLPISVQQSMGRLELRKQELVNGEIGKIRESAGILNGILASLNLPAAIEDHSGVNLPPSLKEKADAVKYKGGIDTIEKLINDLPDLLKRNREILDETERILLAEEESDNNLRSQFKEKWKRTPSDKINKFWKDHITKYRNIIQNAVDADNKVRHKYYSHKEKIQLLSSDDLSNSLPSSTGSGNSLNSPHVIELRKLMNEVDSLKNERQALETGLKDAVFDDMKNKFLSSLSKDGTINEEALCVEGLGEIYGPLQKRVRESGEKQERIIREIQKANEEFVNLKRSQNVSDSRRETFLSELAAAHDTYMELLNNLSEGTKFYNDLTQLLVSLQGKVDDYCFARKAEKEELCKDLQNAIVSQPNPTPPNAPSYHAVDSAPQKPARPPPPTGQSMQQHQQQPTFPFSNPPTNPYAGAPATAPESSQPPVQPQIPNPYQQYYAPPPPLPQGYNPYGNAYQPYPPTPNQSYPAYPPNQYPGSYPGYPPYGQPQPYGYPQQQPPSQ